MLDGDARRHWDRHGWVVLPGFFPPRETDDLLRWTAEVESWPETPGKWMRYYERHRGEPGTKQLARVENYLPYHEGLDGLFRGGRALELLAECCGEPVLLFKDKINLKLPGGAGFGDHQDAPAYVDFGVEHHVTFATPADPFTMENGCIEMAMDSCRRVIRPQNPDGTVRTDEMAKLSLEPVLARPGDVIVFDAWVPHRSGPNRSGGPRRVHYLTFNPASAGDHRVEYYERKRRLFPPECEREPGVDYAAIGKQFNLANPFD